CLRMLGVCGHLGGGTGEVTLPMGHLLFGRSVRGIIQGDSVPDHFIPRLIDLHLSGRFPFDRLISFYGLGQINQAIADMHNGKVIKPILKF
ncbi:MAG: NAD(P)-dependent alcohol dehydrogenase, partial [Anaerolineae bacterium]|nr:NAD(P)-dependent alcohol dehydrogenase [Anaerolineae bacterium]